MRSLLPPLALRWCLLVAVGSHSVSFSPALVQARTWYVNVAEGDDTQPGTAEAPLATAQRAIDRAQPGDIIELLPAEAVARQMISFRDKHELTIEGNGVTLTGADPLPDDGWENVGPSLFRRRLTAKRIGKSQRHLLIVDGRAQRMGRSPSTRPEFPKPEQLTPGQFCWQPIEGDDGWLYVCGTTAGLEWSVRMAGLATSGENRNITVRNLNTRHALNDGFNIHGDARGMRFYHVTGYENFDEGFSAHDTCQCWIEDGRFWGNDNAAFDVNLADSYYRRCEFRDSLSVEVGFAGGEHRLEGCRIVAAGKTAIAMVEGGHPMVGDRKIPCNAVMADCVVCSADDTVRPLHFGQNVDVQLKDCRFEGVTIHNRGAEITADQTTLDGNPWTPATE